MSAWIVSKNHIDVLVTWAIKVDLQIKYNGNIYIADIHSAEFIGRNLWLENYRSINCRYRENGIAPEYHYEPSTIIDIVIMFKQLGCYDYQSCECCDYETTFAYAFVKAAMREMEDRGCTHEKVSGLLEYENAPWGID